MGLGTVLKTDWSFIWLGVGTSFLRMEYKQCTHCKRELPHDSFTFRDKSHTRLSSWCKDCQKQKTLEIRAANIDKYRAKDRENKNSTYKNKRTIINSYKECGCLICGEKEFVCLDFHHVDSNQKSFDIGKQFHIKAIETIISEIKKCVVLCANCHRKVHAGIIRLENYDTNTS